MKEMSDFHDEMNGCAEAGALVPRKINIFWEKKNAHGAN
jgi:hypothetical protein